MRKVKPLIIGGILAASLAAAPMLASCGGDINNDEYRDDLVVVGDGSADDGGAAAATAEKDASDQAKEAASEEAAPEEAAPEEAASEEAPAQDSAEAADTPLERRPIAENLAATVSGIISSYGANASVTYTSLSDLDDYATFAVDGSEPHVSASMIKLAIMAEVFDQVNNGYLALEDSYTVQESDIVGGTGTLQGSGPGTQLSLSDLVRHMIAESDNVATNMLIDLVGMDAVNEEAAKLGLNATSLQRYMMDTDAQAAGIENHMSSDDAAVILILIANGEFYTPELSQLATDFLSQQTDAGGIAGSLSSGETFAHKTGTLTNVRHDAGIVQGEAPYVLSVFVEGTDEGSALSLMGEVTTAIETARANGEVA
ncbi:hypothetical protein GMI70_08625 [Eggerthellaceae bacterium zg-893]|nr:hypothetical protein [Eggerthellaceae bacterium zg-893]